MDSNCAPIDRWKERVPANASQEVLERLLADERDAIAALKVGIEKSAADQANLVSQPGPGRIDQPLRHGRAQQAHGQHARQQQNGRTRGADGRQGQHQAQQLQKHEVPPLQPVAQRHQQHQRQRAPGLRGRDHPAHGCMADAEVGRQRLQQRLGVIDIGHAQAAGSGEQQHQAARHADRVRGWEGVHGLNPVAKQNWFDAS